MRQMASLLIFLGYFAAAQFISGNPAAVFDCSHDFERIYCQLKSQNCSENSLILTEHLKKQYDCPLQQCSSDQCCCAAEFLLIYGEHFTAEVNNKSELKTFYVTESFKPKAPTIKSVKESNGNFQVRWITNMDGKTWNPEETEITLCKKGETKKVSKRIIPAKNDGLQYNEINGQDLDPGAVYVVSLRSFSYQSNRFSNSSQEWEFKTPASYNTLLYGLIVGLSVFSVVIIITALYFCYVKLKENWWDNIPKPKLAMTHSTKPPIITSRDLSNFESLDKELAFNTMGAGSVAQRNPLLLSGGLRPDQHILERIQHDQKDLARKFGLNLQPEIFSAKEDQSNSGSSSIFNQTYSLLLPNRSGQWQSASDSFCSSNTSGIVTDLEQKSCLFPPQHNSSPCQNKIFSYNSSITSKEFESVDESNELSNVPPCFPGSVDEMLKFKNPTYGPLPAASHGFIPMEDGYKPCQCQSEVAEVPREDHNQHFNINPKEFNAIPPYSFQPSDNPAFHPFDMNGQIPCIFPIIPNNSSVIVVSEYHCV